MEPRQVLPWLLTLGALHASSGCSKTRKHDRDSEPVLKVIGCSPELLQRAERFLKAHQSCKVDADCVIINDFCASLSLGWCGQRPLNHDGSASVEWAELTKALKACAPSMCEVCEGLRLPTCWNGFCDGPREAE